MTFEEDNYLTSIGSKPSSSKQERGRSFNSKQSIEAVKVGRSYLIKFRRIVPLSGKKTDFLTYC